MTPEEALTQILNLHGSVPGVHSVKQQPVCGSCGVDDGWYTVLFPCETYKLAAAGLGLEVPVADNEH